MCCANRVTTGYYDDKRLVESGVPPPAGLSRASPGLVDPGNGPAVDAGGSGRAQCPGDGTGGGSRGHYIVDHEHAASGYACWLPNTKGATDIFTARGRGQSGLGLGPPPPLHGAIVSLAAGLCGHKACQQRSLIVSTPHQAPGMERHRNDQVPVSLRKRGGVKAPREPWRQIVAASELQPVEHYSDGTPVLKGRATVAHRPAVHATMTARAGAGLFKRGPTSTAANTGRDGY